MKRWLILGVVATALVVVVLRSRGTDATVLTGRAMGTSWKLAYRGPAPEGLAAEVSRELEHWEQVLSTWRPESDLSRHNRGEPATPELLRVIKLADKLQAETGPCFDIHQLQAVHREGFGPEGEGIDLSAMAKGFAVDEVGAHLRSIGITHFIFELGGEVLAGEGEWSCLVTHPIEGKPPLELTLTHQAIATSGNYYQFRKSEDGTTSHIIDPRTDSPVIRPPSSVTVFANDCASADAWATALFVLGEKNAPENAPKHVWLR